MGRLTIKPDLLTFSSKDDFGECKESLGFSLFGRFPEIMRVLPELSADVLTISSKKACFPGGRGDPPKDFPDAVNTEWSVARHSVLSAWMCFCSSL